LPFLLICIYRKNPIYVWRSFHAGFVDRPEGLAGGTRGLRRGNGSAASQRLGSGWQSVSRAPRRGGCTQEEDRVCVGTRRQTSASQTGHRTILPRPFSRFHREPEASRRRPVQLLPWTCPCVEARLR